METKLFEHTFATLKDLTFCSIIIVIIRVISVREMITFFNKTITKRTPPGQRQSVENQGDQHRKWIYC